MAAECVQNLVKKLKSLNFKMEKGYEKKRKILESEVTQAAYDGLDIEKLENSINEEYTKW